MKIYNVAISHGGGPAIIDGVRFNPEWTEHDDIMDIVEECGMCPGHEGGQWVNQWELHEVYGVIDAFLQDQYAVQTVIGLNNMIDQLGGK